MHLLSIETIAALPADLTGHILPGVVSLLETLVARGIYRALVTGTLGETAREVLVRSRLDPYFPVQVYGDEGTQRADLIRLALSRAARLYGLDVHRCDLVTIGDAQSDIQAGRAVGARTVSVATGVLARSDLARLEPDAILDGLGDEQSALEAILGMHSG